MPANKWANLIHIVVLDDLLRWKSGKVQLHTYGKLGFHAGYVSVTDARGTHEAKRNDWPFVLPAIPAALMLADLHPISLDSLNDAIKDLIARSLISHHAMLFDTSFWKPPIHLTTHGTGNKPLELVTDLRYLRPDGKPVRVHVSEGLDAASVSIFDETIKHIRMNEPTTCYRIEQPGIDLLDELDKESMAYEMLLSCIARMSDGTRNVNDPESVGNGYVYAPWLESWAERRGLERSRCNRLISELATRGMVEAVSMLAVPVPQPPPTNPYEKTYIDCLNAWSSLRLVKPPATSQAVRIVEKGLKALARGRFLEEDRTEQPEDRSHLVPASEIVKRRYASKSHLSKLARNHGEIRQDATPADRKRLNAPKIRHVYDARVVYELIEGLQNR